MPPDEVICRDPARRRLLLESDLDGIDYIEVPFDDQTHLRVYFVREDGFLAGNVLPVDASRVRVEGGVRITDIDVLGISRRTDDDGVAYLEVTVDQPGDFSAYTLSLDAPGVVDSRYDHRDFGFKVGCPSPFDCRPEQECPPDVVDAPALDYLAKDYTSFRQLLFDLIPGRAPEWTDRHEADLGVVLVELLAHAGDHLSYAQDAVANEMYLETARQRESVRRHTRLIDYPMHEGINAKAFVHVGVESDGVIPARSLRCPPRTVRFLTRVAAPLGGSILPPGPVIGQEQAEQALDMAEAVFEPVDTVQLRLALNRVWIHTWGDDDCCLPAGSVAVDLVGDAITEGTRLLLEEVKGVVTGLARDANDEHRQVVRVRHVEQLEDALHTAAAVEGGVGPRGPEDDPLVVTRVSWDTADALRFPLCLSSIDQQNQAIRAVAVARGNIVLVDHGVTVRESHVPDEDGIRYSQIGYRFRLSDGPLTFGFPRGFTCTEPVVSLSRIAPRTAEPHAVVVDGDGSGFVWLPELDLLGTDRFSRSFVAEPDHEGRALLRFGDGTHGRRPTFPVEPSVSESARLHVAYRIGNGRAGNVGRETIVHVVEPEELVSDWPVITSVRNPLAAWGGVDPEPVDVVKRIAPDAFRAETYRAVTEEDYAVATELLPQVARARASLRWTGSWYTVFVTVDPKGTEELGLELEQAVRQHLARYRQTGYDLEVQPPRYAALEIGLVVCAGREHRRTDVAVAVRRALRPGPLTDGRRGFFHADNFTFGQPLHLSRLYAAVEQVEGVDSVEVVTFQRYGAEPAGELVAGRIEAGRLEILRLNDDVSFPEHGVLHVEMRGGK